MAESSVIGRFLRFVFFLALIVFGWTELWPRLQGQISGSRNNCISNVQKQADHFARQIKDFDTRRADQEAWMAFRTDMDHRIADGLELCSCDKPSCRNGRAALGELEKLMRSFHGFVNGGDRVEHLEARIASIDERIREGRRLNQKGQ